MILLIKPSYKVQSQRHRGGGHARATTRYGCEAGKYSAQLVFEDEHLMVINKPAGMVVHPAYQNWTGTLVNALTYHFQKSSANEGK